MDTNFSVLMSVYYKENPKFLDQALNSVFTQTIKPSEVVLVEDGKLTNRLNEVIKKYKKKYKEILKIIKFKNNCGLGIALHNGLLECSNEIVIRMDTDDISNKNRFEEQLKVFKDKNVDVVGSNIAEYDSDMNNTTGYRTVPENDLDIKKRAKSRNPMNHMTIAYKKTKVLEAGNYLDMLYFEDYYLWVRMIKNNCSFYNIQENLVNVRAGNDMIKRRGGIKYIKPIIKFEKELYRMKFINRFEFLINIFERFFFSIIPYKLRFFLYKKILRK